MRLPLYACAGDVENTYLRGGGGVENKTRTTIEDKQGPINISTSRFPNPPTTDVCSTCRKWNLRHWDNRTYAENTQHIIGWSSTILRHDIEFSWSIISCVQSPGDRFEDCSWFAAGATGAGRSNSLEQYALHERLGRCCRSLQRLWAAPEGSMDVRPGWAQKRAAKMPLSESTLSGNLRPRLSFPGRASQWHV